MTCISGNVAACSVPAHSSWGKWITQADPLAFIEGSKRNQKDEHKSELAVGHDDGPSVLSTPEEDLRVLILSVSSLLYSGINSSSWKNDLHTPIFPHRDAALAHDHQDTSYVLPEPAHDAD